MLRDPPGGEQEGIPGKVVSFGQNCKRTPMNAKRIIPTLWLVLLVAGVFAQQKDYKVKVFDLQDQTVVLQDVSSSSSSSCESSDFPVYQGTEKKEVNYADLKSIMVRHDLPAEDPNNYVTVELEFLDGKTSLYEMVKHIRITGSSEAGSYSKKISEINMLEILHKPY